MNEYKNLFSPFKIGSVELKNRLFVPGMGTNLAEHNGEAGEKLIKYYTERAKGGFGLIITECSAISIEGKSLINECGVWGDELIPAIGASPAPYTRRVQKSSCSCVIPAARPSCIIPTAFSR